MSGQERAHYDRLAGSYDENWAYSPDFIAWMTGQILDRLEIGPGDRVLDLGCGTGLYSRGLAEQAGQVLCVDPSRKMLDQLPAGPDYVPIQATAEDIASGRVHLPHERLDAILVKEAIHHVERPSRRGSWAVHALGTGRSAARRHAADDDRLPLVHRGARALRTYAA